MATVDNQDFSMQYDSALGIAKAIDDKRLDFNGMCETLKSLVDSLDGQWEGKAQYEFQTAYKKLKSKLSVISKTMEAYSKEIRTTVQSEQETEEESSGFFDWLSFVWSGNAAQSGSRDRGNHPNGPSKRGTRREGMQNTKNETKPKSNQKQETQNKKTDDSTPNNTTEKTSEPTKKELTYQQKVQMVNTAVPIGEPQYKDWCTGCSRATLIQRKQALEGRQPQFSKEREDTQNPNSCWDYKYTDEAGYSYQIKSEVGVLSQEKMMEMLEKHPEGIMIYKESSPMHAILITHYEKEGDHVQFYAYDPVNSRGDMGSDKKRVVKFEDTWHYSEGGRLDNYQRYSYIE